ncbi:MAG: NAD-glutamate dehydrogenase [Acidimicrobiia bacterium]
MSTDRETLLDRVSDLASTGKNLRDAPGLEAFIRLYFADFALEDLGTLRPSDLAGAALSHWRLAAQRAPGTTLVRVSNPSGHPDGWQSPYTVIEIVTDDRPFLVDSVTMEIERHGLDRQMLLHPIVTVTRGEAGELTGLAAAGIPGTSESFLHIETTRETDPGRLEELRRDLLRVLGDVAAATGDWIKMLAALRHEIDEIHRRPPPLDPDEVAEASAFLEWLADQHFTLLGAREYELRVVDGDELLVALPETGLGILRPHGDAGPPAEPSVLTPEQRTLAHDRSLLVITKANARATVHRPTHLDYIGVKRFDDAGEVVGEHRFLGLFTSGAYSSSPIDIPLLRHKVSTVVTRAGFPPLSHSGKDLIAILETYPRDELFQIDVEQLLRSTMGILQLQNRRRVRLFVRRDPFRRFVTCLVYLPRDRYTTEVRRRMTLILEHAFGASDHEYQARVTESVLARLYFVLQTPSGATDDVDLDALERELAAAARSWSDNLRDALVARHGEVLGQQLAHRYAQQFPLVYQDATTIATAVDDVSYLETVPDPPDVGLRLTAEPHGPVLTLFGRDDPLPLSTAMPYLTTMGVSVVDEHPYELTAEDGGRYWIADFGLRLDPGTELDARARDAFVDALAAIIRGDAENDRFNVLVVAAGLRWREVVVLRTYARYLRQIGTRFSQEYIAECMAAHPGLTRHLVELFLTRFDPAEQDTGADGQSELVDTVTEELDAVAVLDEDRILRSLLHLILATTRTSYFQESDRPPSHLACKLDPSLVPDLPLPRPMYEIFVYSPRVEGVHLRMGRVARGGIRWSDRREDFRTEILGLMKAQMVKNAVIVPVGAKGGFVLKQPPSARDALQAEVVACYRTFIGAMLDITDNLVDGKPVPPDRVRRYDPDDPYLVVAADKGTATFSDIANELALERNFWLGDAFASGGSAGYDHKKMGITAKGAWESVKRHFRQLGIDTQTTGFTVVGIGDMSGDVFGNGMLLSEHIELVAAFDHRHVFLDPNPDPVTSFAERARLFALPRSSWDDYDRDKLSVGGGIHPRTAKSIEITPEVGERLGIAETELAPNDLISVVLRAPVDLLWNGGIGTYVKASTERHADVGDKSNDAIRVDADDLRCRVVGEGGNLGFTQRGRIEYALQGGLIHTDAIDNSAGVDCSDEEVNIKILLGDVMRRGGLDLGERNALLADMTDDVARFVLRDNYRQVRALANARSLSFAMADVHARYLRSLEQAGKLDRQLEFLPDDETLADRRGSGIGLAVPELAVLLAYTKITAANDVLASDLPDDTDLLDTLVHSFPAPLQERFHHAILRHPLRREIVTRTVVNDMVNTSGLTLVFRMHEETGASTADIVRAHFVARRVFGQGDVWRRIQQLDNLVAADVQTSMYLESRKLVERATRWLLRSRRSPLPIGATLEYFTPGVRRCTEVLPELLRADEAKWLATCAIGLIEQDVPSDLAREIAMQESLFTSLDIVDLASSTGRTVDEVAAVHNAVGDRLNLGWLRDRIVDDLPRDDRWRALARSALRDDAYTEHRLITAAALDDSPPGADADAVLDAWIDANRTGIDRVQGILEDIRAHGTYDLANLSVALRELRNLIE